MSAKTKPNVNKSSGADDRYQRWGLSITEPDSLRGKQRPVNGRDKLSPVRDKSSFITKEKNVCVWMKGAFQRNCPCAHTYFLQEFYSHVGDCPVGVRKRWSTHRYPLLSHCLISAVGRQLKLVPAGGILPGKCWLPASHCSGGPPPAFTHEATSRRTRKPKGGFSPQQKINAAIQYLPANTEPTVHVWVQASDIYTKSHRIK